MNRSLLSITLGLLLVGTAAADDKPSTSTDTELAQAREELARATRRYAELSRAQAGSADKAAERGARVLDAEQIARIREIAVQNRTVIGVVLAADELAGVRVTGITPEGGAAKAGLKSGDRLLSVDGKQILGSTGATRVENARKLLAGIEEGKPVEIGYERDDRRASTQVTPSRSRALAIYSNGNLLRPDGNVRIESLPGGAVRMNTDRITVHRIDADTPGLDSDVLTIIGDATFATSQASERLRERIPHLLSAFRWNGLNLASINAELGRYFGTDKGVLVLSTGGIDGLQAGDVIRRVDGKDVATPREVMDVLRDKREGDKVPVDYLRERKPGQLQVPVPAPKTVPVIPAAGATFPAPFLPTMV